MGIIDTRKPLVGITLTNLAPRCGTKRYIMALIIVLVCVCMLTAWQHSKASGANYNHRQKLMSTARQRDHAALQRS